MKIIVSYFIEAAEKFKLSFCKSFLMTVLVSLANLATIIYFRLILNHISTNLTEIIKDLIILCLLLVSTSFINVLWSISLDKFGGEYIAYLVNQCQTSINSTKFENVNSWELSEDKKTIVYSSTTYEHLMPLKENLFSINLDKKQKKQIKARHSGTVL